MRLAAVSVLAAASSAHAAELAALPDLARIRPFVLEREGAFHVLADLAPAWSQLEQLPTTEARKLFLAASAVILVKRDAVVKFPTAASFQVRLVRVVEYDRYNRPLIATARPLLEGALVPARLPAETTLEAVVKAVNGSLESFSFSLANLR